jgi:hypothetical protein
MVNRFLGRLELQAINGTELWYWYKEEILDGGSYGNKEKN